MLKFLPSPSDKQARRGFPRLFTALAAKPTELDVYLWHYSADSRQDLTSGRLHTHSAITSVP